MQQTPKKIQVGVVVVEWLLLDFFIDSLLHPTAQWGKVLIHITTAVIRNTSFGEIKQRSVLFGLVLSLSLSIYIYMTSV